MQLRLTGGFNNTDPNNSRGGAMSTATSDISSGAINNLWDNVGGTESRDGRTEYRCIAVYNSHSSATMLNTKIWILTDTTSPHDEVDIALSTTPVTTGDESFSTVGSAETTNPNTSFDFQHKNSESNSWIIGDIPPLHKKYVWIRRSVQAGAASQANNTHWLRVTCETT